MFEGHTLQTLAWNTVLVVYASKGLGIFFAIHQSHLSHMTSFHKIIDKHSISQDFLRQNNTGKLLWQLFGVQAATLCLFGIAEHEEIMWNAFKLAGIFRVDTCTEKFKFYSFLLCACLYDILNRNHHIVSSEQFSGACVKGCFILV